MPGGDEPAPTPPRMRHSVSMDSSAAPVEGVPVREAVRRYAALQPSLREPTSRFVELVTGLLDEAGIIYLSVDGRTKSVASFAAKAAKQVDGEPAYPDPLEQITDQIGVRVITYVHSDVAAVAGVLDDQLQVLTDRDLGLETAREGRFGYASRHLLVTCDEPAPATYDDLAGHRASVQVRTVLQHAWAEFEHDVRYKGTVPDEHADIPTVPATLSAVLDTLEADHDYLLEGGVLTPDLIETWISYKRENEIDPLRLRPHPYEFALYYDV
jgi:putative GTP pyrophosphokinase